VLCEVHVSSIRGLGGSHYSEAEVDAWAKGISPARYERLISEKHLVVAEHESTPVGFGTLDVPTGEVLQLYVHPDHVRQGVGTLILEELVRVARAAGGRFVHCLASLNAREFYVSAGFEPGPRRKLRLRSGAEVDCIPMRRSLPTSHPATDRRDFMVYCPIRRPGA
jgi:putative acetyltransferase